MTSKELYKKYAGFKAVDQDAKTEGIVVGYFEDREAPLLVMAVSEKSENTGWPYVEEEGLCIINQENNPGGYWVVIEEDIIKE